MIVSGEPLILIPYLAADHACYAFQVAEYAKHFTCISLDLRGTGETDKPEGVYSTELLADDVAAFMQVTGIQKAHISGLSLGAATGMCLAAKRPDKVQSLSLHSGWPKTDLFIKTVSKVFREWPRTLCCQAGLHPVIGRLCSEPASATSRGFHPAVECRNSP